MPHKLLLGFKQNPTTGDDYIDLGGGLNGAGNKGYHLQSYLEGPVTTDEYGHMVRDLTIVVDIDNDTIAGAMAAYHAIDRYIQQTRIYLKPFKGNWAATTDGTWYSGFCATLTFQPSGATSPVYWDVIGGSVVRDETYLGVDLVGGVLTGVTVTLTVRYSARGNLVPLCNLVAMGSFETPFAPQDSYFDLGWTFTDTTKWVVENGQGKFGPDALKWVGTTSTTAYTNESADIYQYTGSAPPVFPYASGAIWLKSSGVTGTTTVTVESYNGTAWSTLGTVASAAGNLAAWTYYKVEGLALTTSMKKLRLKITTPTAGTVYFDGVAIWRAQTVPANGEYFTGGGVIGFPSTYLYGAVGDVEAPCMLHIGTPVDPARGGAADNNPSVMVGARKYSWTSSGRDSIPGMAAQYADGSADATLFWGKAGQSDSGTTSFADFFLNVSGYLTDPILRVSRKYRVVLAYSSTVASVAARITPEAVLTVSSNGSKLFTRTIPSTGGANKIFDLGDLIYPPPDTASQDNLITGFTATGAGLTAVYLYFGGTLLHTTKLNGYFLIPTEYFAYVYAAGGSALFTSMADPENGSVRAMKDSNGSYNSAKATEIDTTGTDNSDTLQVIPGAMQFEILTLGTQDLTYPDLYTALDATLAYTPTLVYQPRYLSGGM